LLCLHRKAQNFSFVLGQKKKLRTGTAGKPTSPGSPAGLKRTNGLLRATYVWRSFLFASLYVPVRAYMDAYVFISIHMY
jgi:hypothetical protein